MVNTMKKNLISIILNLPEYISAILVFTSTLMIFIEVILRYYFYSSLQVTDELSRVIFLWMILLGASVGVKSREHMDIRILTQYFNIKIRFIMDLISELMIIIFGIFFFYAGYISTKMAGVQSLPLLNISIQWMYLSIPVSAALIILYGTLNLKKFLNCENLKKYFEHK
jgi:TRAP-type C4-dicarboxylate transport system permease small subunit